MGLGLVSFLSASYSLYLFTRSQHGEMMGGVGGFEGFYLSEYLLLLLHWLPLNFIFIKRDLFVLYLSSLLRIRECDVLGA